MVDVSVITNTYNDGRYLSRAIHSVACQTYGDLEHLVVDDGSTDDTQAILDLYDYDHLHVVRKPENDGLARARNTGLEYADGRYVVFVDADDELLPRAVETLVSAMESRDSIAICPSYFHVWADGTTGVQRSPRRRLSAGDFGSGGMSVIGGFGGTMLDRRAIDAIGRFDTQLDHTVDFDLCLRLVRHGPMYGINDVLYVYYRGHEGQMSSRNHLEDIERFLEKNGDRLSRFRRSNLAYTLALGHATAGNVSGAKRALLEAIGAYPIRPQYYYYLLALYTRRFNEARRLHKAVRSRMGERIGFSTEA
jgi:glycosyltransferase involved in cell wall biosynthesis